MVRGPAVGYVYGIKDPETGKYVYVGNSPYPWEAVRRHLLASSNKELRAWVDVLKEKHPEGLQILGREVCDKFFDPTIELPENATGRLRVEWTIFGEEKETFEDDTNAIIPRIKPGIVRKLVAEGHPLVNSKLGRRALLDLPVDTETDPERGVA